MSETVQLALIAAGPIIVTQIVIAYLAHKGVSKQGEKLDVIHQQTNSNLTEQRALIESLQARINVLLEEKGAKDGRKK